MRDHPPPHRPSVDTQIGANLVRLRDLRGGMSQAALAEQMRARGWKWSQATVWSVEKGERPLRLAEAMDLSEILDADISRLTLPPLEDEAQQLLERVHEIEPLRGPLRISIADLHRAWLRATRQYEWCLQLGIGFEKTNPYLGMWIRKLSDPHGFAREVARAIRLAEERPPEVIDSTDFEGMLEREGELIKDLDSAREVDDGEHPEEA